MGAQLVEVGWGIQLWRESITYDHTCSHRAYTVHYILNVIEIFIVSLFKATHVNTQTVIIIRIMNVLKYMAILRIKRHYVQTSRRIAHQCQ